MTISLLKHQKSDFDKFENYIKQINEITECIATGGGTDYVLKVITPNLEDFQSLMERLLLADLSIDRYMTYIVTREIKASKPDLMQLYKT
jgi:Lrp/AsnC family transcriptional regulator of ectoine degradation